MSRGYQAALAQFTQVIRNKILWLINEPSQLMNDTVASGQFVQKPPPQGVSGELQELRRGDVRELLLSIHQCKIHQS